MLFLLAWYLEFLKLLVLYGEMKVESRDLIIALPRSSGSLEVFEAEPTHESYHPSVQPRDLFHSNHCCAVAGHQLTHL